MHGPQRDCPQTYPLLRRDALKAGGSLAAVSLAGCLGASGGAAPAAVSLAGSKQCDDCGMVIENHPGPNGQLFYENNAPEGHDNPAWFDSLKQCFFPYRLEHEQLGWSVEAAYVTDYSSVDYQVSSEGGERYVSSFTDADSFAPAEDCRYVVGSEVKGAMGPDFVPFSDPEDAEAFAAEYGGEVVAYDEIDEGLVGR